MSDVQRSLFQFWERLVFCAVTKTSKAGCLSAFYPSKNFVLFGVLEQAVNKVDAMLDQREWRVVGSVFLINLAGYLSTDVTATCHSLDTGPSQMAYCFNFLLSSLR